MQAKPFTTITLPNGEEWINPYQPSIDAVAYHASTARRSLAGGSRGGGKTRTEVEDIIATMLKWDGIPILTGRKDLSDLKKTVMSEFLKRCPEILYDRKYGGQFHQTDNFIRFPNNAICYFGEMKDVDSWRSANLGRVYLDEMHEIPDGENVMKELGATLRWTTEKGECKRPQCRADAKDLAVMKKTSFEEEFKPHAEHPIRQIKMMTNPHGGWLKSTFYTPWKEGRLPEGYEYLPFLVFNNPGVDAAYIKGLMQNNERWVRNFVYGEWDAFEHMAYPNFQRSTHLWKGPIPWNQVEAVEGGIDWGSTGTESHLTAMYLTAKLRTGQYITFWEYTEQGAPSKKLFSIAAEAAKRYKVRRWHADASQFIGNQQMAQGGTPVSDAPRYQGAVKDGVNLLNQLMEVDASGKPQWYYTEDCERLPAALESYTVDAQTGQFIKEDDDEADAIRYNIMGLATKTTIVPTSRPTVVKHPESKNSGVVSPILRMRRQERHDRLKAILEGEKSWQPANRR